MIARPETSRSITGCNPALLKRLLADGLNDVELESVSMHLDHCEYCRSQLDSTATTDAEWLDSKSTLRRDLSDTPSSSSLRTNDHVPGNAVQHSSNQSLLRWLQPCSAPEQQAGFVGILDRYLIKRVVGTGGMGVVFEGWDSQLHRPVAIKAMHPHLASIALARQRFVREARAAAAIVHPNVVAIHSVHADFDPPYLVMPLIAGESLQSRIERTGTLEIDAVLRIASQVADGLAAAHAQGLVHRDVKPANILVEHGTERALLTDFGVVRALDDATMTTSGSIAGTPEYMSPEQARGDSLDHRSDLFSLGSVMYAMLVGRSPFRADSPLSVLRRITDDQPRPIREHNPHTPDWMVAVVGWLHEKNQERRATSASDVATELRRALSYWHDPLHHPLPSSLAGRMKRMEWGRKMGMALPWVVCIAVSSALALWMLAINSPKRSTTTFPEIESSITHVESAPGLPAAPPAAATNAPVEVKPATTVENTIEPVAEDAPALLDSLLQMEIDWAIESVADELELLESSMIDGQTVPTDSTSEKPN